jgi:hypothetical protein
MATSYRSQVSFIFIQALIDIQPSTEQYQASTRKKIPYTCMYVCVCVRAREKERPHACSSMCFHFYVYAYAYIHEKAYLNSLLSIRANTFRLVEDAKIDGQTTFGEPRPMHATMHRDHCIHVHSTCTSQGLKHSQHRKQYAAHVSKAHTRRRTSTYLQIHTLGEITHTHTHIYIIHTCIHTYTKTHIHERSTPAAVASAPAKTAARRPLESVAKWNTIASTSGPGSILKRLLFSFT